MDHVFTIDALLLASRNSSLPIYCKSKDRGLWAESQVAREYLKHHDFVFHRLKTFYGEIDLGFLSRSGVLILIEVKTLSRFGFAEMRLQSRQRQRLHNNYQFILHKLKCPVEFHYVFVGPTGTLSILKEGIL